VNADVQTFGTLLRRFRLAAALTQEELAARTGLSVRGISDLERGARRAPHLSTVGLLADALAVTGTERAALVHAARPGSGGLKPPFGRRPRTRLPAPLTRFVGRAGELTSLRTLLDRPDTRLVTLTGAGGIGKTRLAIALADDVADAFLDGVVLVDLAPVRDVEGVPGAVAAALDIRESDHVSLAEAVVSALAVKQILLLLDNFEHLLPAASWVVEVLQRSPGVAMLVTSRRPLRVRGEREFLVQPLGLPSGAPHTTRDHDELGDAVALFIERARDARSDFALSDATTPAVAEIVTRLDGLPLAIELAAAWSRTLPPPAIAARLERRLPLLSLGATDAPPRHRTMRAAIAWSHDLLAPEEQSLFRRLSVFVGGFGLEALRTVAGIEDEVELLHQVTRLAEHNLIVPRAFEQGEPRYAVLETIQEFGREQLVAAGEAGTMAERHALAFLDLAERGAARLHSADQGAWIRRLETDLDNVRAALAWAIDRDATEIAARFGAALWLFWLKHGLWTEGREWLRRVLSLPDTIPDALRAEVLLGAGNLAGIQGHPGEAGQLFDASLAKWREAGSMSGVGRTLSMKGVSATHALDFAAAVAHFEASLPLFDLPRDEPWAAHATSYLGFALIGLGELDRGLACAEEGLARQQAAGEHWAVANAFVMLAAALTARGEHPRAAALFANALAMWADQGAGGILLWPLLGLAGVARAAGRPGEAATLIGFYQAVSEQASAVFEPYFGSTYEREVAVIREQLGEAAFAAARERARATTIADILPEALRIARELAGEG
jgi:predicted ATPase/DNA-binding XRE family transcriptional regulator